MEKTSKKKMSLFKKLAITGIIVATGLGYGEYTNRVNTQYELELAKFKEDSAINLEYNCPLKDQMEKNISTEGLGGLEKWTKEWTPKMKGSKRAIENFNLKNEGFCNSMPGRNLNSREWEPTYNRKGVRTL